MAVFSPPRAFNQTQSFPILPLQFSAMKAYVIVLKGVRRDRLIQRLQDSGCPSTLSLHITQAKHLSNHRSDMGALIASKRLLVVSTVQRHQATVSIGELYFVGVC